MNAWMHWWMTELVELMDEWTFWTDSSLSIADACEKKSLQQILQGHNLNKASCLWTYQVSEALQSRQKPWSMNSRPSKLSKPRCNQKAFAQKLSSI